MPDDVTPPAAAISAKTRPGTVQPTVEAMLLHHEVEAFLYNEAALLDERQYPTWLTLFTQDVRYWMPIRRTTTSKDRTREFTSGADIGFINDDYSMLATRVKRLKTGYAWAEDPPSRTRRFVTNVRVVAVEGDEFEVHSNFHLYRTRLNSEEDSWIGHREDLLRRTEDGLKIARRSIFLEQTVLLSPNLSNFF